MDIIYFLKAILMLIAVAIITFAIIIPSISDFITNRSLKRAKLPAEMLKAEMMNQARIWWQSIYGDAIKDARNGVFFGFKVKYDEYDLGFKRIKLLKKELRAQGFKVEFKSRDINYTEYVEVTLKD